MKKNHTKKKFSKKNSNELGATSIEVSSQLIADLDVAIIAGSGVREWPCIGALTVSDVCTQFGLRCGLYGGRSGVVRGVLPEISGGWVIFQDIQGRLHEIHARSIVRFNSRSEIPDPFVGIETTGWLTLSSAEKLHKESGIHFHPRVAIYGASPNSIRFALTLLNEQKAEVVIFPTPSQSQMPQIWSVDFNRFLMLGGQWVETGAPISEFTLESKAPLLWTLKIKDKILEVSYFIVAGSVEVSSFPLEREYPRGSLRFEMESLALATEEIQREDREMDPYLLSKVQEEEAARSIALKIVRALHRDLGRFRDSFERLQKLNQIRRKKWNRFKINPLRYHYSGKLLTKESQAKILSFEGVPKRLHELKQVASIECLESIGCQICQEACPTNAIQIQRLKNIFLDESKCTACGFCLQVCPSQVPVLIHAPRDAPMVKLTFADATESAQRLEVKEAVELLNRKGETLGQARVIQLDHPVPSDGIFPRLITVEVQSHLLWEARAIRSPSRMKRIKEDVLSEAPQNLTKDFLQSRFEILLDGEKRWVREKISISVALFELGKNRPGDRLLCEDGSCGLCTLLVDGQKQLACKTRVRRGMIVRRLGYEEQIQMNGAQSLQTIPFCYCAQVSVGEIEEKLEKAQVSTVTSAAKLLGIGSGRCHGILCEGPLRRKCSELGSIDDEEKLWTKWVLPDADWQLS